MLSPRARRAQHFLGPVSTIGDPRQVLTPSQLNALARDMLEGAFPLIWVEGELSGVARPASGHLYFTLKDARAQVRCAMFKPRSALLKFRPADGTQVLLRARLTLYEARGDYQLVAEHMEEAGEGAWLRAFEERKARLAAEGLFDPARKRRLPRFPRRLGVITSPSGAAVRDVLTILRRRFPLLEVDVLPTSVQGAAAPAELLAMLQRADRAGRHDVLLLTRGGGSLEDLQAFNDEALARAIAAAATPTVSGVGHEVDTTLADFVADLRAATPSAAAELIVPDRIELLAVLRRRHDQVASLWRRTREVRQQRLDQLQQRLQAQRPAARLQRGRERLDALHRRLALQVATALRSRLERQARLGLRLSAMHPRLRLADAGRRLDALGERQHGSTVRRIERHALHLRELGRALNAVSPLATLERGYATLHDRTNGRIVRSIAGLVADARLTARLVDGEIDLRIEAVRGNAD
jgi:exodeoxyribonuclease VII large subunit